MLHVLYEPILRIKLHSQMTQSPNIHGLKGEPYLNAIGQPTSGRFVCHDVQWTGTDAEAFATFTITTRELVSAIENSMLFTDQDVQRGVKPERTGHTERTLNLRDGYPSSSNYVFDADKADDMVEKLLTDRKLFLNPLIWNLRPNQFEAYYDKLSRQMIFYEGNIYLPDSHHRHQAILKAYRTWITKKSDYPKYNPDKQYKVELYFLSKKEEGDYFFAKNQLPKPTSKSKSYDLTTQDDLSILAKIFIDRTNALKTNVNRVTDRLTAGNSQVVTLSTIREMMRTYASDETFDETELEGLAVISSRFYDMLAAVRPELGVLELRARRRVREHLLVDSATMMHGYAYLMKDFGQDVTKCGMKEAIEKWTIRLKRLSGGIEYSIGSWKGDFFDKMNPIWLSSGIEKHSKGGGKLTVTNTGASRSSAGRLLRQLVSVDQQPRDLEFLTV